MPAVNILKEVEVSKSIRARQLSSIFDFPSYKKQKFELKDNIPIDNIEWNIGLIVGHSGCGKSTIGKELFGNKYDVKLSWKEKSVIDDFNQELSIQDITKACSSVGFNSIPSWLKPFHVLSTGEKFRVEVARKILELDDPIVIDEFTSVIDRQVAKIGSDAIQKFIRKMNKKFVAISCHYDIIEWLQPDWIYDPEKTKFTPRGLLQRPKIEAEIRKTKYDTWKMFSKYHYMNAELKNNASCYATYLNDSPVCFVAVIHLPHHKIKDIKRISRIVVLPDYQGIGIAQKTINSLGEIYKKAGYRLRNYPQHPGFIRSMAKNKSWKLIELPKLRNRSLKSIKNNRTRGDKSFLQKRARGAVFEYIG